jgi:hypothetical protein
LILAYLVLPGTRRSWFARWESSIPAHGEALTSRLAGTPHRQVKFGHYPAARAVATRGAEGNGWWGRASSTALNRWE